MTRKELREFSNGLKNLRDTATDKTALNSVYAYAEWKPNTEYSVAERIRYGENLYRCVQAHTSQEGWEPNVTPALWVLVSLEEWPEWVQPIGAQDAYKTGDKVSHNGSHWISSFDNNVWEPGVYGWEVIL